MFAQFNSLMFGMLAEDSPGLLSINPDLAIYTAIVFVVMLLVLGKFAWKPIMEGLEKREQSIADNISQAEDGAQKAAQLVQEHEAKLAAAADEVSKILTAAKKDAEVARDRIVAEAQEEAGKIRDRALAEITNAKDAAIRDLAQKSVDAAVALAGNLVRSELSTERHSALIQESLDSFAGRN